MFYVSENEQNNECSKDCLYQFEENVHGVSNLAKKSAISDQINLVENRYFTSRLHFHWFQFIIFHKVMELWISIKLLEFQHFFIVLCFRLFIRFAFTQILRFSNTHHIQVKLGSIHELRTFIALSFKMVVGLLCWSLIDASSIDK